MSNKKTKHIDFLILYRLPMGACGNFKHLLVGSVAREAEAKVGHLGEELDQALLLELGEDRLLPGTGRRERVCMLLLASLFPYGFNAAISFWGVSHSSR